MVPIFHKSLQPASFSSKAIRQPLNIFPSSLLLKKCPRAKPSASPIVNRGFRTNFYFRSRPFALSLFRRGASLYGELYPTVYLSTLYPAFHPVPDAMQVIGLRQSSSFSRGLGRDGVTPALHCRMLESESVCRRISAG